MDLTEQQFRLDHLGSDRQFAVLSLLSSITCALCGGGAMMVKY